MLPLWKQLCPWPSLLFIDAGIICLLRFYHEKMMLWISSFQVEPQVASLTLYNCEGKELVIENLPPANSIGVEIHHHNTSIEEVSLIFILWNYFMNNSCVEFFWQNVFMCVCKHDFLCFIDMEGGGKNNKLLSYTVNSLWPSDAIWWHRSGSTLVQEMAWCLTAPSHFLNQCWLLIS